MSLDHEVLDELAPTGTLRTAINLSNFLLVSGRTPSGDPDGVAPDMARAIAERCQRPISFITYPRPGELADAAGANVWDVALIGAEPERAKAITFSQPYCEIASTYLVPAGSQLTDVDSVDRPGVRIAVAERTAYGLWLERHIRRAELVRAPSLDASFDIFVRDKLDVLAGLKPRLLTDLTRLPGARLLEGQFSAVQQSVGVPKGRLRAAAFLREFVAEAVASGILETWIRHHRVQGLSVARPTKEAP